MRTFRACVVCAAAALCMTNPARAAFPVPESTLGIRALDAKTEQALQVVVVKASEHYYWTAMHSSGTTCFRAAARRLESGGETGILRLPAADPLTSAKVIDETRHVEVFGYRAGYCVAQPYASAQHAGFVKWANKGKLSGGWGTVETPQFGSTIVLRLKPSNDAPERRLRYLARIDAGKAQHARLAPLLRRGKHLRSHPPQGIEQSLLLRRSDVEAIDRQQLRLVHLLAVHARGHQIGQRCRVGMPIAFATQ